MTSPVEEEAPLAMDALKHPKLAAIKPKDAASLILLDRSTSEPKVLMGRRGGGHVFMPGVYVFPGGKRDPRDFALPFTADLDPLVHEKLGIGGVSASRARALALAALRELEEETGILSGESGPDLSRLRYVARATTPPGHVRRYDTRFFLAMTNETAFDMSRLGDSSEMLDVGWIALSRLADLDLPNITRTVMQDVKNLLSGDPALPFGSPVPFYSMRHGRFVRSRL